MIRFRTMAVVALAALLAFGAAASAPASNDAQAGKKKLLVVTWTTGFRHSDSIAVGEKIVGEMADRTGQFTVDYCRTQDDVTKMLTPQYLDDNHYDGVMFLNTTGNLHIPDLHAFLDWIKAGHGFIGTHSAADTYHPSDTNGDTGYVDMLGAEFRTHGRQAEADCIVEDRNNPATRHLGPEWKVTDEIYHMKVDNRPTVHVLLALKTQPMDGVKDEQGVDQSGKPTDMLIAWTKMYGKGRVFYTALGHRTDVWESQPYQQHLLGGIRWALGLARGSARPQAAGRQAEVGPVPHEAQTVIPVVNISDADLNAVANALRQQYGVDVVVMPAGKRPYNLVNLSLCNKTADFALRMVARSAGARIRLENSIYTIGPGEATSARPDVFKSAPGR